MSAWLAGALSLLLLVAAPTPAFAQQTAASEGASGEECPLDVAALSGAAEASTESQAVELAALCGVPVEDVSARDYSVRSFAQPSGLMSTEMHAVPQWTKDDRDQWVDIDTRLVQNPDGSLRAAAVVGEVRLSGGGTDPFVTLVEADGDASLSLRWPGGGLPAPQVDGDVATYREVMPGVDLAVTAGVDGFSYALVVHTPQAAANPALARVEVEVITEGVQAHERDGRVNAVDAAGEPVFVSGPAFMWDTPPLQDAVLSGLLPEADLGGMSVDDLTPNRISLMEVELTNSMLAVVPDAQLLADAAAGRDVVFPLYIDPAFHDPKRSRWATVHQQQPNRGWTNDGDWPRAGGIRMGNCSFSDCDSATGVWRGVMGFDTRPLRNRHIASAAVKMTQTHTGGCDSYHVQLWHIFAFTNDASWNDITWRNITSDGYLQRRSVASSNSIGGCSVNHPNRDIVFNNSNVRARVQHHADSSFNTISFGVRSNNESHGSQWRRVSHNSLVLEVQHASYPQTPTNLSTDGQGCATSEPGPWLTTGRPSLGGTPRNADGTGRYFQQLREVGSSSNLYTFRSGVVPMNVQRSRRVPEAETLPDGAYRWRMRSESRVSGVPESNFAAWCYFRVDTTPPPQPEVVLLTGNPQLGGKAHVELIGSNDTDRFRYSLNSGSEETVTASGGSVTVELELSETTIDNHLQVWALDEAGNLSDRHDLFFTASRFTELPVPVAGVWRFDNDWRDDSGYGHHLTASSGVAFTEDREGRPESAAHFDGEGRSLGAWSCAVTDGPVLRTDEGFTVAAWVRGDVASNSTIIGQAGVSTTAFSVGRADDRWRFAMTPFDSVLAAPHAVGSLSTPTGDWEHVTAVYDADDDTMRLYVNGELHTSATVPFAGWNSMGPLSVGCRHLNGMTHEGFEGSVDDVVAYQGVLSDEQVEALVDAGPPAGLVSWWPMRGDGADAGPAGHDLTTVEGVVSFVPDSHGRTASAMQFDGGSCVATDDSVLVDRHSFTLAAWVRSDDTASGSSTTIVSQQGETRPSFQLRRHADGNWQFLVASGETTDGGVLATMSSTSVAQVGQWTHLMAVVNIDEQQMRLYVDGVLEDESPLPWDPWHTNGPLHVGCAANAEDGPFRHFVGAVHDVRVWRGAASPVEVDAAMLTQVSSWALNEFVEGNDSWGGNHLSFHGSHQWVENRFGACWSAYGLPHGTGFAETNDPGVLTDESFSVSAWARLANKNGDRTVVAQAAPGAASLELRYDAAHDRWVFAMRSQDDPASGPDWQSAWSSEAPQIGVWYHLVAVFNVGAGTISLYVDGELQDTVAGPQPAWHVDGEFLVGSTGDTDGARHAPMAGVLDEVRLYAGALDAFRIADLGFRPANPPPPGDCDFF